MAESQLRLPLGLLEPDGPGTTTDHAGYSASQGSLSIDVEIAFAWARDGFVAADHEGRILYANPAACRLFGELRKENGSAGNSLSELEPVIRSTLNRLEFEASGDSRHIAPILFGTPVHLLISRAPWGAVVHIHDTAPEVRIASALRDSEAMLGMAERCAGIGVWDIDLDRRIVRGTPEFFRLMGLPPESGTVPLETTRNIRHPEDRDRVIRGYNNAVQSGQEFYESSHRIVRPDGEVRWIFGRGRITRDATGRPVSYSGVDIDATDRMKAEERLRQSEQQLRELNEKLEELAETRAQQLARSRAQWHAFFENSPDWLTLLHAEQDGRVVFVDLNPAAEIAYGSTRDQVVGRTVQEILGAEQAGLPLSTIRECLASGKVQRYVAERTFVGNRRIIDVMIVPVSPQRGHGGNYLITTARDITEREEMQSRLRRAQKMEALGSMTGGIAHDFNNILTIIMGQAELAQRQHGTKAAQLLENIVNTAERGAALTRQLLAFSRDRVNNPRPMDVSTELQRIFGMLRSSLRKDINLRLTVQDGLWPVEADPNEWELALLNIVMNGRDAIKTSGVISINASNESMQEAGQGEQKEYVRIAIRDSGIGISPENLERVFDPFFTTKPLGAGTGLGLSQVERFIERSKGLVRISSQQGVGTEISCYLPRTQKQVAATQPLDLTGRHPHAGKHIMLVEDNPEVSAVTEQMITQMGFRVTVFERASVALDALRAPRTKIDLLLSDVIMPDGINGFELARTIRLSRPDLPILLMTGYNEVVDRTELALTILRKPFTVTGLSLGLSECFEAKSSGPLRH